MKFLERFSTVFLGCMWVYFAVASFGAGERMGPVLAFVGMLFWAQGVKDFNDVMALAENSIALTDRALALSSDIQDQ